jgi:ribosomal protein S18 acetylase RimI-like enzyme
MKNIKLIVILLASIICINAEKVNIISQDTYIHDLIYKNQNSSAKIAFLKEKQLREFAQLFLENSENLHSGDDPEKFIDYLIRNKEQYIWGHDFKNKLNIMSCAVNKNLAGFVCFIRQTNNCERYSKNNQSGISKVGYIALLCVSKNYRQQKIGKLLISSALNEMFLKEQVKYVTILTTLTNQPAQNLFEKMGFQKINEDNITGTALYKITNYN